MAEGLSQSIDDEVSSEANDTCKQDIKELRAKIQSLKKSVSKGDKKRRKEVNLEIASLESKIQILRESGSNDKSNETQNSSINETETGSDMSSGSKETGSSTNETQTGSSTNETQTGSSVNASMESMSLNNGNKPKSKAQRKRDKKSHKIKEREKRIAEGTVDEEDTAGGQESSRLISLLEPLRLTVKDIAPDGNCLYTAISDQLLLKRIQNKVSAQDLRVQCAQYIRTHMDDFQPFITNPDTGDLCTREEFDIYCDQVEDPSVWGGQVEIEALSRIYRCPITVHQAYTKAIVTGEGYNPDQMLHLSYHQHLYTLGKHYNSVVPIEELELFINMKI